MTAPRRLIGAVVAQGVRMGTFRRTDPLRAAAVIVGLVDGVSLQLTFDPTAFSVAEATRFCGDAVLRYLTLGPLNSSSLRVKVTQHCVSTKPRRLGDAKCRRIEVSWSETPSTRPTMTAAARNGSVRRKVPSARLRNDGADQPPRAVIEGCVDSC